MLKVLRKEGRGVLLELNGVEKEGEGHVEGIEVPAFLED